MVAMSKIPIYAMGSAEGADYLLNQHKAVSPILLSHEEERYFNIYVTARPSYDWFPTDLMELARIARMQCKADQMSARIDWDAPNPKQVKGYIAMESMIRAQKVLVGLHMTSKLNVSGLMARRNNMQNLLSEPDDQVTDQETEGTKKKQPSFLG